jgi:hypothetical protein
MKTKANELKEASSVYIKSKGNEEEEDVVNVLHDVNPLRARVKSKLTNEMKI